MRNAIKPMLSDQVVSLACTRQSAALRKLLAEIEALPNTPQGLDDLVCLLEQSERERRGIYLPSDLELELTVGEIGEISADAEIEVCVGGTTQIAPFVTVKLPLVCKKIKIPNPFD